MNIMEKFSAAKPVLLGAVLGAVVVLTVGFSGNILVSTATMQENIVNAQISAYGELCERNARTHWQSQGKQMADLDGWRNDTRQALADQFAADLTQDVELNQNIAQRCDNLLRPA